MENFDLRIAGVGLFTLLAVFALGIALSGALQQRRDRKQSRRRLLQEDAPVGDELESESDGALSKVGMLVSSGSFSDNLNRSLAQAGFHSGSAAATYLGAKLLLFGLGVLLTAALWLGTTLALPLVLLCGISASLTLFLIPNLVLIVARQRRRTEIQRHLPDAIDLLEVCVSSGMGLDMAWNAVTDEMGRVSSLMAEEMELTKLEMGLGASRTDAMRHMAERTGADEVSSLVALLVQSERFGSSVAEALRVFAGSMRDIQSKRAEESAEKMSVKLLFPMVLFIFPALLIVMVGPAVMNIVDVML